MHSPGNLDSTIFDRREQLKGCVSRVARHYYSLLKCGCSSVGRAPPCQGGRREFEPRHPLQPSLGAQGMTASPAVISVRPLGSRRSLRVLKIGLFNGARGYKIGAMKTTSLPRLCALVVGLLGS